MRTYTIAQLLSRQPKSLQKNADYMTMMRYYEASARLQRMRISRRCYSLLDRATVEEHNLHHFYRTYRLPPDPFFAFFFAIKRGYLVDRERIKRERTRYIFAALRSLPEPALTTIKYLGYLERHYNSARATPVWQRHLFPHSKKAADAYRRKTPAAWHALFRRHLTLLSERYGGLSDVIADRILACYVLGITPQRVPPPRPSAKEIGRSYRRMSMLHHPDRGGDAAMFIAIKRARDLLVGGR